MTQHVQGVRGISGSFPLSDAYRSGSGSAPGNVQSFQDVLGKELQTTQPQDLKFSMHALERIRFRNIHMGAQDVERLKQAVDQVDQKGGKESLVFMNDSAFLVSVANRTVITAVDSGSLSHNVFTNIDSAVIA